MKLVLFDVDGTLLDSQHLIYSALSETLARMERPLMDRAFMLSIVGLSLETAMVHLLGPETPTAEVERAAGHYRDIFQVLRADPAYAAPLFPGALETVAALRRRDDVVLGIATGKSQRGVAHILDGFGWRDVFATVQTADDAPSKPHPAMVLQAGRAVGVPPEDIVMIGDTSFDIAMGRAAGARTVGVSWGNHTVEALREAGADHIIEDFAQLPPLVDARPMAAAL
ncbi:HAD-IA family hydrolase [Labrys monachus]|uniref:Phosphoglycolate phosphatase n=1 Tax=Labrys monachus TaxID=217067 RepID=A0ABU0FID5_9HYPH|nr:HAD-IA family hydrolase [Labrys monachus]MDQ0394082.1 phosphoglycolate phosphatase [Labrys monachus]